MPSSPEAWYDAWYFRHCCGRPYERSPEWLEFFGRIADRIVTDIGPRTVMDVGCAMGFLVEALRDRGVEAFGIDISEYALQHVREDIRPYVWKASILDPLPGRYDLIVCIEVLEHLPSSEVEKAINHLCQAADDILFSSTPHDFGEPTHLNAQPPEYWAEQFARRGFFRDVDFDASFITPWAIRFRRSTDPLHRVVARYERKFWRLRAENVQLRSRLLEWRDQLARLEEQTSTSRIHLTEAEARLKSEQQRSEALVREIESLRTQLAQTEQKLKSEQQRSEALVREIESLRTQLAQTEQKLQETTTMLNMVYRSKTWRWTEPLRKAYLIWKNLRTSWQLQLRWLLYYVFPSYISPRNYQKWIRMYDTLTEEDRRAIRAHIEYLAYKPLISVIMPTYNTPEPWLRRAIESVRNQLYPYWELCIADDASEAPHVRRILREYQEKDPRIRVVFRDRRGHISECSNTALELAQGEFIALLDHDDELAEHALYMVAVELNAHPEADLLYSDEDKIDAQGNRFEPYFKPDWNPDLFYGQNLITHLGVYRTQLVREVGGFRPGYEGAQDWDLALRIIERIPPSHIRHIPFVLYHWRAIPGSAATSMIEKPYVYESQKKALISYFERRGIPVRLYSVHGVYWRIEYPLPTDPPLVSLIIPTHNGYELLSCCVESIFQKTTYRPFEILIVNHQSDDPQTLAYLERLSKEGKARVIDYEGPFNFSRINNEAVRHARGTILGFLNNDVEVISPGWLSEMVSHALRPEIGAVGAMLYYPDDTIQHGGVILGILGVAGHAYRYLPRGTPGQMGRAWLAQDLSAVTGACLLMRRDVFEEVGGFDEQLAVAFNDVDLCLRIRERGYRVLWTPFAELYHREGVSRGKDTIESERFLREIRFMQERWGEQLLHDPAYNPNLTLEREDFSLAFPPRVSKPWRL
jgi:GT2 family glycosyltransferase